MCLRLKNSNFNPQRIGVFRTRIYATSVRHSGNFRGQFHHLWCSLPRIDQSYVNGGLQRPPNVLLSGPFKKVSSVPRNEFYLVPRCKHPGQINGVQAGKGQHRNGEPCVSPRERAFVKTGG